MFNWFKKKKEKRNLNIGGDVLYYDNALMGGGMSTFGATPLTSPVVLAVVKMLSEDIAGLPLKMYRKDNRGGAIEEKYHYLNTLLTLRASATMSALAFRFAIISNILLHGNCYVYIRRDRLGQVYDFTIVDNDFVRVEIINDKKVYDISDFKKVEDSNMLHFFNFTLDGKVGINLLTMISKTLTTLKKAEDYSNRAIDNVSTPSIILEHTSNIPVGYRYDEKQLEQLKRTWNATQSGVYNSGRTAVLPPNYQAKQFTLPQSSLQMIETRLILMREFSMVARVPLWMLNDVSAENNIANQAKDLNYLKYSIMPYLKVIEQELNNKLFSDVERKEGLYFEHNATGLLRGDDKARSEFFQTMFAMGVYSINEIRALEGLPSIENGDAHYVPLNKAPVDNILDVLLKSTHAGRGNAEDGKDNEKKE